MAQSYSSETIKSLAKSFVEKNIETPKHGKVVITPADIDPRIEIKPCKIPLSLNIPENNSSRNVNVKISCEDSTSWVLFLPVRVETQIPVLIANQSISKGSLLDNTNIELTYIDQFELRGEAIKDINEIIGAKAKRTLTKGRPISPRSFCVVCKGDNVDIIAKSAVFMIQTEGVALKDANIGEQIRVKNNRSGRTVTGTVSDDHKVIIN
ncbi:flagella basal body P-ring formation protein FlgA [Thalassotalea profundi]|uniref:Flagella basal body P-ring formation protein FlgA n=2 Tax=Thalassotalea profundi TaxID=2036687 RepID=A0ABQ3IE84_9GAMM|nr:flagella basal body P-ring formation protein FlgA [Thalassotalea profundi]